MGLEVIFGLKKLKEWSEKKKKKATSFLVDEKAVSKKADHQWLPNKIWTEQRCSNREGKLVFLLHVNDFKVCIQTNNPSYFFEGDTLPEELLTWENIGKVSISEKAVIKIGMNIENLILISLSLKAYHVRDV